jgi:non-lysosomal glucosylceramidase
MADDRVTGRRYAGAALGQLALPLGGVGTGNVAICGDGGLRQWQISNRVNHRGFVPDTFFAIRASTTEPPGDVVRILQAPAVEAAADPAPNVDDGVVPEDQRRLLETFDGVRSTSFESRYPFAGIAYEDPSLPVEVALEAHTPLVPLDAAASGLPLAVFRFTLTNRATHEVHGCLGAALQNAVGWDGILPIRGNRSALYGGNVNRVRRRRDHVAIVMDNPSLPEDDPRAGEMALVCTSAGAIPYPRWSAPEEFVRCIEAFNADRHADEPGREESEDVAATRAATAAYERTHWNRPAMPSGPSAPGTTWNGGLLCPFALEGGESTEITFVMAWHFPNRYVNFDNFGAPRDYGHSRFWLGNAYAERFADVEEVVGHWLDHREELTTASREWADSVYGSTLPDWLADTVGAQASLIRSPTCFEAADGQLFGFEGSLGVATGNWNSTVGGSCPLNCNHVWNFEQALSRMFPQLERTMRDAEMERAQAPDGSIAHRVIAPLYLPQFGAEPIGGPTWPALDGMLGAPLKIYREVRQGAGQAWLERMWPRVTHLMDHVSGQWDPDGDGTLEGEQPTTFDVPLVGRNLFTGSLWLAALRACEEMARIVGDGARATWFRATFERGSAAYDTALWGGEYYVQELAPGASEPYQYGRGLLSSQLLGQWWADQLELGHLLPEERVRKTIEAILAHNLIRGFDDVPATGRAFADGDDAGLLNCTWPEGGRPDVPLRYCDEVWTGVEYQVAAQAIAAGLETEGLRLVRAVRDRYDGTRRNPYNEIECGDHYSRAMAGWTVLEALSGVRYDAHTQRLSLGRQGDTGAWRLPFVIGSAWGTCERFADGAFEVRCLGGELAVSKVVTATGAAVAFDVARTVSPGSALEIPQPAEVGDGARIA